MKQLRWFKSSVLSVLLNHPLTLDSTFLHSSDPLMIPSCSAPVQQNKQAEKYSPFLPGYYSVILVHWFGSPRVRWMPDLSQESDRCAWPGKGTDFWSQCIVVVVLWRLSPKLWETWNISGICMLNLLTWAPEMHTIITWWHLHLKEICHHLLSMFYIHDTWFIGIAHHKECWKLKKRLEVSEIYPESVTVFKILFILLKVQWRQRMPFNKPWIKPIKHSDYSHMQTPCV